jgi:FtsP/CotA-like multicopper oxidase with cupredoxin domain
MERTMGILSALLLRRRLLFGMFFCWSSVAIAQDELIQANDNHVQAGDLQGNVLTVNLVADSGMWFPAGPQTHGIPVQAFREEGGPLQVPGPLLRMNEGTEVAATIRNEIPDTVLILHGFQTRPSDVETTISIPFGETGTVRFTAGNHGAYSYTASTQSVGPVMRTGVDSQLLGAFVIDKPGNDRVETILVLSEYLRGIIPDVTGVQLAINGSSWPATPIQEVEVGKVNRWHVINPSFGLHPMHLHGVHYKVVATGTQLTYSELESDMQAEVVTHIFDTVSSATIEWTAGHEGNWLFHCHIPGHVSPAGMISAIGDTPFQEVIDAPEGMSGMALGIRATDNRGLSPRINSVDRRLTMVMDRRENYYDENPGFAVSISEGNNSLASAVVPGPTLVLNKDEAVSINLVNNLNEPTSIHWHGMELESYYDGVAGYSGNGTSITPRIESGGSFEVRMKPPRAGTYFYHTHMKDDVQLAAGLYGALIVSDPDNPYNPETDRLLTIGLMGEGLNVTGLRVPGGNLGINGTTTHEDFFKLNQQYRLRIINITNELDALNIQLSSVRGPEQWTAIAKDGTDLPGGLRKTKAAKDQLIAVGEAYDFYWTPTEPGPHWFEARRLVDGEFMAQALLMVNP